MNPTIMVYFSIGFVEQLRRFIVENLYFNQFDPTDQTPKMIRKKLFDRLLVTGYVEEEFSQRMEKREAMSSTSFPSGIAVPHLLE